MDFSIKHASQLALYVILCSIFLYSFGQFIARLNDHSFTVENEFIRPNIRYSHIQIEVDKIALKLNEEYSLNNYVRAVDEIDGNISEKVQIYDNINIQQKGYYQARFVVKNSNGQWADKTVNVRVDE